MLEEQVSFEWLVRHLVSNSPLIPCHLCNLWDTMPYHWSPFLFLRICVTYGMLYSTIYRQEFSNPPHPRKGEHFTRIRKYPKYVPLPNYFTYFQVKRISWKVLFVHQNSLQTIISTTHLPWTHSLIVLYVASCMSYPLGHMIF